MASAEVMSPASADLTAPDRTTAMSTAAKAQAAKVPTGALRGGHAGLANGAGWRRALRAQAWTAARAAVMEFSFGWCRFSAGPGQG